MRKKWRFSSSSGDFVILDPDDLFPEEIPTCDPSLLTSHLDVWLTDAPTRQSLLDIITSLERNGARFQTAAPQQTPQTEDLKRFIADALQDKKIVALSIPRSFLKQTNTEREAAETAPPVRENAPRTDKTKTVWIEFRVVDDATGAPIHGVELQITLPQGQEVVEATNANGLINIEDIKPGSCRVTSVLTGATLTNTFAFVQMGTTPSGGANSNSSKTNAPRRTPGGRIAEVTPHKVKTNESLSGLAKANKISEQELELFNFGTTDPEEINRYLRDRVGCSQKTRDGRNYLFDSGDKPGLIYIPKKWKKEGLATEQTHTIRVKQPGGFYVILENEYGLRIPEAQYEATLADNSKRQGTLGLGGVDLIENPPPGRVLVDFKDHEDVEVKSLAACARNAFDKHDTQEIFRVLNQPPERVKKVVAAYDKYFNDYTGSGLVEDIYQEFTDRRALIAVEGALAWAGLPTHNKVTFVKDEE